MNILHRLHPGILSLFVILPVIVIFFFIFPADDLDAKTLRFEISPDTINQGDAFVIRVTGVKSPFAPTATMAKNKIPFSRCGEGCFHGIGAVGIDTKTGAYLVKVRVGKARKNIRLTVRKGAFQTVTMTLPQEQVTLSPADLKLVKVENKHLKALFLATSERQWEGKFLIPVQNEISTPFGMNRIMNKTWTSIHRGVDIRGAEGEGVKASNNGKVVLAQGLFFGGNTIVLDHGQGIYTVYMHLSHMKVRCGDTVSKGDIIGLIGSTGRSTGPHLHFGVKISNVSVNPLSVLSLDL